MSWQAKPLGVRLLAALSIAYVLICGAVIVGAALYTPGPQASWARWQAAAQRVAEAQRQQLLQTARTRNERAYIAYVQGQCGDEAWYRPREGALPTCTDKHGRATGVAFEGVQP